MTTDAERTELIARVEKLDGVLTWDEIHTITTALAASTATPGAKVSGASLIAAERGRQVAEEGYTAKHDAGHHHQLMAAAIHYTRLAYKVTAGPDALVSPEWPWQRRYWKPTGDRVCDLTKAGALIAAAIDSLLPASPAVQIEPESTAPEQQATTEREWSIYSESSDTRVVIHHEMKLNDGEREQGWLIETREVTTTPWLPVSEERADLRFPQTIPKAAPKPEEGAEQ